MPERYPYGKRNWYPHLSAQEAEIWDRFIEKFPDAYDSVEYDIKIGPVPDFVANNEDPAMQKQAPLYRYKIDVIGYKDETIDIIELKQKAQFYTVGQVKGYWRTWSKEHSPPEPPRVLVITGEAAPEVGEVAQAEGVVLIVV